MEPRERKQLKLAQEAEEKKIILEFLELYKDLPCLWDINHDFYHSKEARQSAYQLLLQLYRKIEPCANLTTVKKKIESLRTGYRREKKMVVLTRIQSGVLRKPALWYYEYLKFLDDDVDMVGNASDIQILDCDNEDDTTSNVPTICLTDEEEHQDTESYEIKEESVTREEQSNNYSFETMATSNENTTHATEAFGKAVGLQLNEMNPTQRFIAEKLISDVIYCGRFEKLNAETSLNLN